ncbi:MAG: DUF924 family protein [Alphaproteobacteria bacterium]
MADPVEVLDYWVGELGEEGWFDGGAEVDAEIRQRFGELWDAAAAGGLEHWVDGVVGTLAYLLVCDQMARNMHRGTPAAFATDAQARAAARRALAAGWDLATPEPERMFFYLPFEHSEDPTDQVLAVELMTERLPLDPVMALHARAHQQVIARFGRFPFRNAALGRVSTPEEAEFLASGGYGALVEALRSSR